MKKYELTDEKKQLPGMSPVFRIRALKDIPRHNVKAGDYGGFVETEMNLSHSGDAWIADEGYVFGLNTQIAGHALVSDNAIVDEGSFIQGENKVSGNAYLSQSKIQGKHARITGNAHLHLVEIQGDNITIEDTAFVEQVLIDSSGFFIQIRGNAKVIGNKHITKFTGHTITIEGNAELTDCKLVSGTHILVKDTACIEGGAILSGKRIHLTDASSVSGTMELGDDVILSECAQLHENSALLIKLFDLNLAGDMRLSAMKVKYG